MNKTIINKKLLPVARKLRKQMTLSEILLWECIKNKQIGFTFNRQQSIGPYVADFLCRKQKAVIEIDGDSHDGKGEYDKERDEFLKSHGLIVIHIHDYEVKKNIDGVLKYIKDNIKARTSTEIVTRY